MEERLIMSEDVKQIEELFLQLNDKEKLELIGTLLEKLDNQDIFVDGKLITPEDIGIDDCFFTYSEIFYIVDNEDFEEDEDEFYE